MKYLMSEEEAMYMQAYQGHFSRKLASWAIGNMEIEDPATKEYLSCGTYSCSLCRPNT